MYKSFVSLGRYIPKYFILFVAMVNGIVSLISLSVFSLLVYKNAKDFCVLILYSAKKFHFYIYLAETHFTSFLSEKYKNNRLKKPYPLFSKLNPASEFSVFL